ncbi:hypothetical protein [Desulfovibrio ferrophilus]|uniref:Lipoprotein n=1 Tax=Desulfovibrio ferrophilus TaxID=241368 RepID=A0A2Z6AW45_9BACT|nr:hypothetical protein [Desulfovibrio ferrophilus]BBD07415.1 uncharacterized protein DFE_0689 [Desulfovibrio ferrophilus]
MIKRLVLLALPVLLVAGCQSQLPMASSYPMTTQHKMQAAEHWDILAADVAQRIKTATEERIELRLLAIDIDTDQSGPFHDVFQNLLKSQLVFRGLQVADKEENQLEVKYKVQVVKHGSRFQRPPPGLLTAIGSGIAVMRDHLTVNANYAAAPIGFLADIGIGYLNFHSNHEVVITTEMVWKNRYVVHCSDIYYINDPDYKHYGDPIPGVATVQPDPMADIGVASMGVVNE